MEGARPDFLEMTARMAAMPGARSKSPRLRDSRQVIRGDALAPALALGDRQYSPLVCSEGSRGANPGVSLSRSDASS